MPGFFLWGNPESGVRDGSVTASEAVARLRPYLPRPQQVRRTGEAKPTRDALRKLSDWLT